MLQRDGLATRTPREVVEEHERWRECCLNLIPSENVMSPQARVLLGSEMVHRYTIPGIEEMDGRPVENAYRGTRYMDEIETMAVELACELYGCEYACVRPISGHISAMIALNAVCHRGDGIMSIDFTNGGYPGYSEDEMAGMMGLRSECLPFDEEGCDIDYDAAVKSIAGFRPRAVVIGASKILFPPDVEALSTVCSDIGADLLYDASHVLGLMAGGQFGRPLEDGVGIMFGSTHKTLFGPQGGIAMTDDRSKAHLIEESLHWKTLDNAHWNRIACLAQVLLEMKEFGEAYARQTILNARQLAKAVERGGLPVQCADRGYTASHQVGLRGSEVAEALGVVSFEELAKRLEQADIIIDCVGRLGTCEVTRLGMERREMDAIGDLICRTLVEGEDPDSVKEDVHLLRKRYRDPVFCFN
jgi:glycine hydroxymethyltransferase